MRAEHQLPHAQAAAVSVIRDVDDVMPAAIRYAIPMVSLTRLSSAVVVRSTLPGRSARVLALFAEATAGIEPAMKVLQTSR